MTPAAQATTCWGTLVSMTAGAEDELPVAVADADVDAVALAEDEPPTADADPFAVEAVFDSEDAVAGGPPNVAPNVAEELS